MVAIKEKTIDIDNILKSKMGAKAKFVPRPLVAWLKHIVHQDQVNDYLWESRHLVGTEWLEECVRYLDSYRTTHWEARTAWHSEPSSAAITTGVSAIW